MERHKVTSIVPLRQLALQVLSNPSAQLSMNKLHGDMRSRGVAVSKDTLYAIAAHLEDAYLFQSAADGYGVDFVLNSNDFEDVLIQSCAQMDNPETYERELRALRCAMREKKQRVGWIVSLELEKKIKTPEGLINIVPAWKFFLEPQNHLETSR